MGAVQYFFSISVRIWIPFIKGIQILTEIEEKILNGTHDVMDLTNQFYSVIPVVFENPMDKSNLLDTLEKVQAKKEWLHGLFY